MARLALRGPDGSGVWTSEDGRSTLVHTRLAIQDLTEGASQPMRSPDGSVTLLYNGEIYNAPALRLELEREGTRFRTRSDTAVLLESLRLRGMSGADDGCVRLRAIAPNVARLRTLDTSLSNHPASARGVASACRMRRRLSAPMRSRCSVQVCVSVGRACAAWMIELSVSASM